MTREKTSGIKVHIGVDANGLPHAARVTTADVSDREGAIETLRGCAPNLTKVAKVLCDGGYSGENFARAVKALMGAEVEAVKRNELHRFAVLPKRRVVERTFGWLEKYCRLWKNYERKIHTMHAANDGSCVYLATAEKILNRFLQLYLFFSVLSSARIASR
jgi:transposase